MKYVRWRKMYDFTHVRNKTNKNRHMDPERRLTATKGEGEQLRGHLLVSRWRPDVGGARASVRRDQDATLYT